FFFQAEDGIRDDLVTGVQTCALPIFAGVDEVVRPVAAGDVDIADVVAIVNDRVRAGPRLGRRRDARHMIARVADHVELGVGGGEIGRASCREGGWARVGGGTLQRR